MRIGDLELLPMSDGTFVARPAYFTRGPVPDPPPAPFGPDGVAWLPIGCFLVRTGDRVVLVDAGLGPARTELPDGMALVGGQLPTALLASGTRPEDVTDVVCTHLHSDHVGWLFDHDGRTVFPAATVWFGAGEDDGELADHVRAGLRAGTTDAETVDGDHTIAPGVDVVATPGHTPGHLAVVVSGGGDRAILVGDAITCPVQLAEPTWHSFGDADPDQADRSRELLWAELARPRTVGTGAHFPELRFGRVASSSSSRTWR
ncbi:MBL fold metallo-hydrolase [Jiangella mangrovi]|uniref:Glyoxylase-like metal-dependent hydrolase (Beta-lactamase superfamily II) n=1 Tax=Jiangella mangrovi TaxID=1524084 RepID=A0A7W9GU95_9ACTN|nr:MBL fold metallo-hydrolase [Jiangella mangrovi]MBB5790145.1 glyoxylase-like metal-dependent hydrolase (beta-lactamase superfamily II) [Jiangella mangrovi]